MEVTKEEISILKDEILLSVANFSIGTDFRIANGRECKTLTENFWSLNDVYEERFTLKGVFVGAKVWLNECWGLETRAKHFYLEYEYDNSEFETITQISR